MRTEGQRQSRKQEDRLANRLGGSRTAGSGSFWSRKGDVRTDDLVIEAKWTGKTQYTLKAQTLEAVVQEAVLSGRTPVLGIHLNGRDYVVLTEDDFIALRDDARTDEPLDPKYEYQHSARSDLGMAVFGKMPQD